MGNLGGVFSQENTPIGCTETHKCYLFQYKQVSWRNCDHEWLRMTNAFILYDLLWKAQKSHAANREGSFKLLRFLYLSYLWLDIVRSTRYVTWYVTWAGLISPSSLSWVLLTMYTWMLRPLVAEKLGNKSTTRRTPHVRSRTDSSFKVRDICWEVLLYTSWLHVCDTCRLHQPRMG